MMADMETFDKM